MNTIGSIRKSILMLCFAGVVFFTAMANARAQTVWLVCHFDTSSIWKDNGRDKFERRFYVSGLVSMSKEDYLRIDRTGNRIEGLCGDYLDQTVVKATTARGERLDTSGQLKIIRNIELSGENIGSPNPYNFAPKEKVEKQRDDDIKEMKDANRIIYSFNWDPTGKNEQADAENEMKRTSPTIGTYAIEIRKTVTHVSGTKRRSFACSTHLIWPEKHVACWRWSSFAPLPSVLSRPRA